MHAFAHPPAVCGDDHLNALYFSDLYKKGAEDQFDQITNLAQQVFNVPIVLITLIDGDELWFKSCIGLKRKSVPRSVAFCEHTIQNQKIMVVTDTLSDARFQDNILVTGAPHIRFYGGTPLLAPNGNVIGTLCILDTQSHHDFSKSDSRRLTSFGRIAGHLLNARFKHISEQDKNAAKTEFLSYIAHEIRTPLNAITGISHMLRQEDELSGKVRKLVNTLDVSAHNLLDLVNAVLDISVIETRHLKLTKERFMLAALADEVRDLMDFCAAEKGIGFYLDNQCERDLYYLGDRIRIRQFLLNLIGNAIKFTQRGGVAVYIRKRVLGKTKPKSVIEMTVDDTGCGMNKHELKNVFEPFYQIKNSPHGDKGTGLGLAISRDIIVQMGGKITVKSTPGKGTTFMVRIPDHTTHRPIKKTTVKTAKSQTSHDYYKVLLVQDDTAQRMLLAQTLKDLGYDVDLHPSHHLHQIDFDANPADIVIIDLAYPRADIEKAFAKLGNNMERPRIIGFMPQSDVDTSVELDGVLTPEMSPTQVFECIEKILTKTKINNSISRK